ncbi:MAG: thioredoxin family protein [Nitrososphaeria archaeon]
MFDQIETEFNASLHDKDKTIVVVFYATYCPFCAKFSPCIEKYSSDMSFLFAKADITDDDNPFWDKYRIVTVPTLIAFRNGKEVARKESILGVGLDEDDLNAFLDDLRRLT